MLQSKGTKLKYIETEYKLRHMITNKQSIKHSHMIANKQSIKHRQLLLNISTPRIIILVLLLLTLP